MIKNYSVPKKMGYFLSAGFLLHNTLMKKQSSSKN